MADEAVPRQLAAQELLFRRAKESFLFFFEHIWVIQIPRVGPTHPKMRPFQREVAELLGEREGRAPLLLVALKARQIGFTTLVAAYAVWFCLFHNDSPWLLASRNEPAAKKNLARAAYGYRRLPQWFKDRCPELVSDSTERLAWANESRIDSIPASAGSGRSDSVYGVLFDEAAHMDDPAELFASLQPLCYGPFLVFSSANGMGNWFHDRWLEAKLPDSAWTPIFCGWDQVESRSKDWHDHTLRKYRGQLWMFYQEFPSDDTEAFARSGRVAFGPDLLKDQRFDPPQGRYRWTGLMFDMASPLEPGQDEDLELWVWKGPHIERDERDRPLRPPNYVVYCDPAEGLSHGDETAVVVWDANNLEVCATSLSHYPIEELEGPLAWLGYHYCTALMMVERNNQGILPIVGLTRRLHYPRMYRMAQFGQIVEGDRTPRYGWVTSRTTKPKMVHDMLRALREGTVQLHDPRWLQQAATYVADGRGGYSASENNRDDLMSALLGGWQGVLEVGQYPTVWVDDRTQPPTWKDVLGLEASPPTLGSSSIQIGSRGPHSGAVRRSITLWPSQNSP
jgi:hypothetical protein